jgi:hypothetical protein
MFSRTLGETMPAIALRSSVDTLVEGGTLVPNELGGRTALGGIKVEKRKENGYATFDGGRCRHV